MYESMVQSLDTVVGQMIAEVSGETYVVLLADNGTPTRVAARDQDPEKVKRLIEDCSRLLKRAG